MLKDSDLPSMGEEPQHRAEATLPSGKADLGFGKGAGQPVDVEVTVTENPKLLASPNPRERKQGLTAEQGQAVKVALMKMAFDTPKKTKAAEVKSTRKKGLKMGQQLDTVHAVGQILEEAAATDFQAEMNDEKVEGSSTQGDPAGEWGGQVGEGVRQESLGHLDTADSIRQAEKTNTEVMETKPGCESVGTAQEAAEREESSDRAMHIQGDYGV
ncbi:UNVERIFIED_CONTAM: hypothetical protein FKN15_056051 [Acipenser sinensis]